jgi:hypothetical protein
VFLVIDLISMDTMNYKTFDFEMNSKNKPGDQANCLFPNSAQKRAWFALATLFGLQNTQT